MNMQIDGWTPLIQNFGQKGSEGGTIIFDDEMPEIGRVTIEEVSNPTTGFLHYCVTVGVYGLLVHTAFFSTLEDAKEGADIAKLIIIVLTKNS